MKHMQQNNHPVASDGGMALLLCTIFIALTLVILATLCARVVAQAHHMDRAEQIVQLDAAVEAAVTSSIAAVRQGASGTLGFAGTPAFDEKGVLVVPAPDSPQLTPLPFPLVPGLQYFSIVSSWGQDGIDNNRDGAVDEAAEASFHTVYAFATFNQMHRGVEVVLRESGEQPGKLTRVSWREIPVHP